MATEWTKQEQETACDQVDVMLDSTEIITHGHYGYNAAIVEAVMQRNGALAALNIARGPYIAHMYGHEGYGEGIKQIDAAIAACEKGDAR